MLALDAANLSVLLPRILLYDILDFLSTYSILMLLL